MRQRTLSKKASPSRRFQERTKARPIRACVDHAPCAKPKTTNTKFDAEQEAKNRYLVDRTREEITAYYAGLLVGRAKKKGCVIGLYDMVKDKGWLDATTRNNFAWAFATMEGFSGSDFAVRGLKLAKEATSLHPICTLWDTLSCAHAAVGQFEEALEIERSEIPDSKRIDFYQNERSCYEQEVADANGC